MTGVLQEEGNFDTEESHVTGAETGVMWPQAQGLLELSEAGEAGRTFLGVSGGRLALPHLDL